MFHLSKPRVLETNLNCSVRTNVVCDRSEPQIKVDLGEAGYDGLQYHVENNPICPIFQETYIFSKQSFHIGTFPVVE